MNTKAIATLTSGDKIRGWLTTNYAASRYRQPVFVDDNGQAYNWAEIADIVTTAGQSKGGSRSKPETSRENGRKGGRPRKSQGE